MKLAVLALGLLGCNAQETVCPTSWGEGKNKCFKFIGKRMKLKEAAISCKQIGGTLFAPSDETEISQLQEVARRKAFGLRWPSHQLWIGYKIKNTGSTAFPPAVVGLRGNDPPQWLEESKLTATLWDGNVKKLIRYKRNIKAQMKNIKMIKGKWSLTKPGLRTFGGAAVCEMPKPKVAVGNPDVCWQPQSDIYDSLAYTGDLSFTEQGYECAAWDDESTHAHKWSSVGSHNYCRNPDGEATGPWCYVNNEEKWDFCGVPKCKEPENEFVAAQSQCGRRPIIDEANLIRVIGGRPAELGEVPYQVRLRYYKKLSIGGKLTDHQCGGTMISSCWAITAAHCIPTEFWFTSKGGGEFWFRVDVGNRFYQKDLDEFKEERAEDYQNHQTLRVKQIIMHPRYTGAENDLALLQLYPTSESGECAVFGDTVQPTCINQENHRFPEGTECTISGWGDINQHDNGIQMPDALMMAKVKIFNFEECAAAYKPLSRYLKTRKHVCAKGDGIDTCQGDSGGPLVCFIDDGRNQNTESTEDSQKNAGQQAFLAGVVSFGAGCAKEEFAGVYVPTSYFYDWIKKEVDKAGPSEFKPEMVCRDAQCRS